uniref:Uncharacterized protein n=1 Tax=Avena sativa TaxID=4498 RepID=A0ACD6AAA7_AVESA
MIFWRVWFAHNEVTHEKDLPSIEDSARFLLSYLDSLTLLKQHPNSDPGKGKEIIDHDRGLQRCASKNVVQQLNQKEKWEAPPITRTKLNVDGSYLNDGTVGAGMVLRDSKGMIIFAACRQLRQCSDAVDAELAAMEEGLNLALHWSPLPICVETDCSGACLLLKESTPNTLIHVARVHAI